MDGEAAVDEQGLAGDVAGRASGEEHRGSGEVVGQTVAAGQGAGGRGGQGGGGGSLPNRAGINVIQWDLRTEPFTAFPGTLAFVDKDQALFRVGPLEAMLRPEALSRLYGRAVAVREVDGRWIVYPMDGKAGRVGEGGA